VIFSVSAVITIPVPVQANPPQYDKASGFYGFVDSFVRQSNAQRVYQEAYERYTAAGMPQAQALAEARKLADQSTLQGVVLDVKDTVDRMTAGPRNFLSSLWDSVWDAAATGAQNLFAINRNDANEALREFDHIFRDNISSNNNPIFNAMDINDFRNNVWTPYIQSLRAMGLAITTAQENILPSSLSTRPYLTRAETLYNGNSMIYNTHGHNRMIDYWMNSNSHFVDLSALAAAPVNGTSLSMQVMVQVFHQTPVNGMHGNFSSTGNQFGISAHGRLQSRTDYYITFGTTGNSTSSQDIINNVFNEQTTNNSTQNYFFEYNTNATQNHNYVNNNSWFQEMQNIINNNTTNVTNITINNFYGNDPNPTPNPNDPNATPTPFPTPPPIDMRETNSLLTEISGYMQGFFPFLNSLLGGQKELSETLSGLNESLSGLDESMSGLNESMSGLNESISGMSDSIGSMAGAIDGMADRFSDISSAMTDGFGDMTEAIDGMSSAMNDRLGNMTEAIDGMSSAMTDGFGGLRGEVAEQKGILGEIRDYIGGITDYFKNTENEKEENKGILEEIRDYLRGIFTVMLKVAFDVEYVPGEKWEEEDEELDEAYAWLRIPFLGNFRIARKHPDVETETDESLFAKFLERLFVPSEGFLDKKVEEFNETLEERLPVIAKIFSITDELTAAVREQTGYTEDQHNGEGHQHGFVPSMFNISSAFGDETEVSNGGAFNPFRIENGVLMPVMEDETAYSPFLTANVNGFTGFSAASYDSELGGGSSDGGGVGRIPIPSIKIALPPEFGGETVDLIDFGLFAQYRPFIHGFMIVIAVVTFVIRLKKKIPRIIHS